MYHEKPVKIVKVAVNLNLDRRNVLLEVFTRKKGQMATKKTFSATPLCLDIPHTFPTYFFVPFQGS